MFVNSDFTELLKLFNDASVRYLVIGGYAIDSVRLASLY
jgi:hypothetical protein